jgi:uncharacterized membrane protein
MRRLIKVLHEIGAVGMMGSLAACVVLVMNSPPDAPAEFAAVRHGIVMVHTYLYVPSLMLAMVSGLIAIAATDAYKDAGWAWMKALTGVSMFEGSLLAIVGPAKRAAALSAEAVTGGGDAAPPSAPDPRPQCLTMLFKPFDMIWSVQAMPSADRMNTL